MVSAFQLYRLKYFVPRSECTADYIPLIVATAFNFLYAMSTTTRTRQPKFRQSCDGCFLAKVKCGKQRPICTRCLSVGLECRYSPSQRQGKTPKSDQHIVTSQHHELTVCLPTPNLSMYAHQTEGIYPLDGTSWPTAPLNSHVSANMALIGVPSPEHMEVMAGSPPDPVFSSSVPWTPPSEMVSSPFVDTGLCSTLPQSQHARSHSFDVSTSPWDDSLTYATATPNLNHPPSIIYTSGTHQHYRPSSVVAEGRRTGTSGSCTCFNLCLQSLQALHNASSPSCPPLDTVLSLNRKAVDSCATMLACQRCMRRSGIQTTTMLLGASITQITTLYKIASKSYFDYAAFSTPAVSTPASSSTGPTSPSAVSMVSMDDGTTGLGLRLGSYRLATDDSRCLEAEILARELRKLEEVYARFREVCNDLENSQDSLQDVGHAMVGYLEQSLGDAMEVITTRRGDTTYP